jgi:hypothetical protein
MMSLALVPEQNMLSLPPDRQAPLIGKHHRNQLKGTVPVAP